MRRNQGRLGALPDPPVNEPQTRRGPGGDRLSVTVASSADGVGRPTDEITGARTIYTLRDGALSVLEEDAFASRPTSDSVTMVDAASCG